MALVHAHVFDPLRPSLFGKRCKTDHAEYHTVECSRSADCELFARRQCIARIFMAGPGCDHGRAYREIGPTPKARGYFAWLQERRAAAEPVGYLDAPKDRLARVADTIWLPYAAMSLALDDLGYQRPFVPVEEFTADLVVSLCAARPRGTWIPNELIEYQRKSIPLFVAHLSESYPALLAEAAPLSPRIREILARLTRVGRKAKLATLRPNVGTFDGWTWDGTHMIATDRRAFPFTPFEAAEMRIVPGPDAVVTVTDNGQCTPETVFVD